MNQVLNNDELKVAIAERKSQIISFVTLAHKLLDEYGVKGSSTTVLKNVGNFTFEFHSSESSHGGNKLKIYYHPESIDASPGDLVFELYFQCASFSIDECEVLKFAGGTGNLLYWQNKLSEMAENVNEILADLGQKKREEEAERKRQEAAVEEQKKLAKEAKRLGIELALAS